MSDTPSNFDLAVAAVERSVELFEEGSEDSFQINSDETLGTLELNGYTIYVRDEGPNRIMDGTILVGSFIDPVEAVIETVGIVIAGRTKVVLREFLIAGKVA